LKINQGMSQSFEPRPARERLIYAAMSLFVVWHTVAMVLATSPNSEIARAARTIYQPYLTLFGLDNNWGFFAPNVPTGYQFRYVVEDAAGQKHTFIPDQKLSRFDPNSIWVKDRYKVIMESPDIYGEVTVAALCREHAALRPVAVTLLEFEQQAFSPSDRLSGKWPLDPGFVKQSAQKTIRCPTP
jgi:hypothetical protein